MKLCFERKMICLILLCTLLFSANAQADSMMVAVSPFENVGMSRDSDYLGFQIAEFLSSALAAFEGIQVIERQQLQQVFKEQQIQLSGVTDGDSTVELGRILNARQLVVGSFNEAPTRMSITARIVDTETGELLSSGTVESPKRDSYSALYRTLLFELISGLPQYEVTIPVEATLESIDQQARRASENYARALEALFRNDDEDALRYLQESISGEDVDIVRFDTLAREYSEVLGRIEGSTIYTQMIQRQIDHNRSLTEQMDPLSLYRSTLRVLSDRVSDQLVPENFEIDANIPLQEDWLIGDVSVAIPLPSLVSIALNGEAISNIQKHFQQQDVASLGRGGLTLKAPPAGILISQLAMENLFRLGWEARIGYAVEFLDGRGEVLFRLLGHDIPVFIMGEGGVQYERTEQARYSIEQPEDGWQLRDDNTLEVQSRNVRNLASVRVVVNPDQFSLNSGFLLYHDIHWQSLVTHAYRKKSVKIDVDDVAVGAAFKEIVISDSRFYTGDEELDPVPILPRERKIAFFARPTAYVYMADNASGTVSGLWQGQYNSSPFTGEFSNQTVLHFHYPEKSITGTALRFAASFGSSAKTIWVDRAQDARTTYLEGRDRPAASIAMDAEMVYIFHGGVLKGVDRETGQVQWEERLQRSAWHIVARNGVVFFTGSGARDAKSGRELWSLSNTYSSSSYQVLPSPETGNVYFFNTRDHNLVALDITSGLVKWEQRSVYSIALAGNKLVLGKGSYLDIVSPLTGRSVTETVISTSENRSEVMAVSDDIVVTSRFPNITAYDLVEERSLWRYNYARLPSQPNPNVLSRISRTFTTRDLTIHNGIVYVITPGVSLRQEQYILTHSTVQALDLNTGTLLWENAFPVSSRWSGFSSIATDGVWLYLDESTVLDPSTGQWVWTSLASTFLFPEYNAAIVQSESPARTFLRENDALPRFSSPMHLPVGEGAQRAQRAQGLLSSWYFSGALSGSLSYLVLVDPEYTDGFYEGPMLRGELGLGFGTHGDFGERLNGFELALGFGYSVLEYSTETVAISASEPEVGSSFYVAARKTWGDMSSDFGEYSGGFTWGLGLLYFPNGLSLPNSRGAINFALESVVKIFMDDYYMGFSLPFLIAPDMILGLGFELSVGISHFLGL